jgi:hypothetical protein
VALLLQARDIARRCGNVPAQRMALANLIKLATDVGDGDGAKTLLDEAIALMPGWENRATEQAFVGYAYQLHRLRGDDAALLSAARRMIELARGLDERRVLIETIEIVFDDLLRCAGLEEAGAALAEAESALAQLHPEIALSRAAWHLARGDAAAAEAAWASAPPGPGRRASGAVMRVAVGTACGLALGQVELARQRLLNMALDANLEGEPLAELLTTHLALALALDHDEFGVVPRAEALLASVKLPPPQEALLREALQRFTHRVATPR